MTSPSGSEEFKQQVLGIVLGFRGRRPPERELLELLRTIGDPSKLDRYIAGAGVDWLMEVLAGFMYERIDNLLANTRKEDKDTRDKLYSLAYEIYQLYIKARLRQSGIN